MGTFVVFREQTLRLFKSLFRISGVTFQRKYCLLVQHRISTADGWWKWEEDRDWGRRRGVTGWLKRESLGTRKRENGRSDETSVQSPNLKTRRQNHKVLKSLIFNNELMLQWIGADVVQGSWAGAQWSAKGGERHPARENQRTESEEERAKAQEICNKGRHMQNMVMDVSNTDMKTCLRLCHASSLFCN